MSENQPMEQSFRRMNPRTDRPEPGQHWMGVTQGMSGFFAVELWVNPGQEPLFGPFGGEPPGPFAEPWDTGVGRYRTEAEACVEAYELARIQNLPYDLPHVPGDPAYDEARRKLRGPD